MGLSGTWNQNTQALRAGASLIIDPLFYRQTGDNARGTFSKPPDIFHQNQNEGIILIPGFLCNPGVMRTLGEKIGESRNVIYPDIGMLDSMQSLDTIAEKIAQYIQNLNRTGEQKYTIIGHSLGGILAILVAQKLKVGHIIQLSTPNATPPVAKLSGLGYIPAIFDLRNVSGIYDSSIPSGGSCIARLTTIIPKHDQFIGVDVQGTSHLPQSLRIGEKFDIPVPGGHLDPLYKDAIHQQILAVLDRV